MAPLRYLSLFSGLLFACGAKPRDLPGTSEDGGTYSNAKVTKEDDAGERPCGEGYKRCGRACVLFSNPAFGCGDDTCDACYLPHANSSTCAADGSSSTLQCAIRQCDRDYGNCDQGTRNGCETPLKSDPQHCGACDTACRNAEVCSNGRCQGSCDDGLTDCDGGCVDLTSDPAHCGGCTTACPVPAGGTATCAGARCGIRCNAGYHACGAACGKDTDPATCGTSCTACAAPANATATCDGVACDFTCDPGFNRQGNGCAPGMPTLAVAATIGAKAVGTFLLDANVASTRLLVTSVCPNASFSGHVTNYQYVRIANPTSKAATLSVWTSKAAAGPDIDTILATYWADPTTSAERLACVVGVNDICSDTSDPTTCVYGGAGFWAGLMSSEGNAVTVPAGGSVIVYVAAYDSTTSTNPHSGPYTLSARTEALK
jgi:hypothetical protein